MILEDLFEVHRLYKSDKVDYHVELYSDRIYLKPVNLNRGRHIELNGKNIILCQDMTQLSESSELFKIVYCTGDSLDCKSFVFNEKYLTNSQEIHLKADKWINKICQSFDIYRKSKANNKRKMLVFINPQSGKGQAVSVSRNVKNILSECGLEYELVVTERQGHAKEYLETAKNISQINSILILSGDGLVYEALNGLYGRQDWKFILQTIALSVLPLGSGNGLSRSIRYLQNEDPMKENGLKYGLLNTIGGRPYPMDIFKVIQSKNRSYLGFLSLGFGLFSEISVVSENSRFFGGINLDTICKITQLKNYKCKVSYLAANYEHDQIKFMDDDDDEVSMKSHQDYFKATKIPDSIDESLGEAWTVETNEYISIYVVNLPYADSNAKLAPRARLNDGFLWLIIFRKGISKWHLIKSLSAINDGRIENTPNIDIYKVKAVRLEPEGSHQSCFTIDGEPIEFSPVQISVLPSAARVLIK